jgi:hypothetical protein
MSNTLRAATLAALALTVAPAVASAEELEVGVSKDAYDLLNPVPATDMRPLMPGETPITVDPGHVQLEVNLANATWQHDATTSTNSLDLFSFAAKVGLTRRIDAQFMFSPYSQTQTMAGTTMMSQATGIGDATARLKINVLGNEGGTGLALVPYVTLPTGVDGLSNGAVEGGLVVPLAFELPAGCVGQVALDAHANYLPDTDSYEPTLGMTATVVRPIAGPVGGVVEWTSVGSLDGVDHLAHVQATIGIGDNAELDAGVVFTPADPTAMAMATATMTWRR